MDLAEKAFTLIGTGLVLGIAITVLSGRDAQSERDVQASGKQAAIPERTSVPPPPSPSSPPPTQKMRDHAYSTFKTWLHKFDPKRDVILEVDRWPDNPDKVVLRVSIAWQASTKPVQKETLTTLWRLWSDSNAECQPDKSRSIVAIINSALTRNLGESNGRSWVVDD